MGSFNVSIDERLLRRDRRGQQSCSRRRIETGVGGPRAGWSVARQRSAALDGLRRTAPACGPPDALSLFAMAATSISVAKNRMNRAVDSILDPWPVSKDPIWTFFDSACAYCGLELARGDRRGHIDHATPGAGNHLGNLVLACAACNGDEKLDMDWRPFLEQKVADAELRHGRAARIEEWQLLHPKPDLAASAEVAAIESELRAMAHAFGAKCAELRAAVRAARTSLAAERPDRFEVKGRASGMDDEQQIAALLLPHAGAEAGRIREGLVASRPEREPNACELGGLEGMVAWRGTRRPEKNLSRRRCFRYRRHSVRWGFRRLVAGDGPGWPAGPVPRGELDLLAPRGVKYGVSPSFIGSLGVGWGSRDLTPWSRHSRPCRQLGTDGIAVSSAAESKCSPLRSSGRRAPGGAVGVRTSRPWCGVPCAGLPL